MFISDETERLRLEMDRDREDVSRLPDEPAMLSIVTAGLTMVSGGVNDKQTISAVGPPTGGAFKLTLKSTLLGVDRTTNSLAYNCTAADVQTELQAIVRTQTLRVATGSPSAGTFTISGVNPITSVPFTTGLNSWNNTAAGVVGRLNVASGLTFAGQGGDVPLNPIVIGFVFIPPIATMTVDNSALVGGTYTIVADATNVLCTGGPLPNTPIVVTFTNTMANTYFPKMTVTPLALVGGSIKVTRNLFGEPTYPTVANAFYKVAVGGVFGIEAAGQTASVITGSRTDYAYNLGTSIPPPSTKVLIGACNHRLAFRYS